MNLKLIPDYPILFVHKPREIWLVYFVFLKI